METHSILRRFPELKEFFELIRKEMLGMQRPANEIVLTDEDVQKMLGISKRKLQYLISDKIISFHKLPGGPRRYFLLSDILEILSQNRSESITAKF